MLRTPDVLGPMTPDAVISCRGEEGGLQTPSLLARLSEAHRRNDRSLDAPLTTGDDGFHNCGGGSRHIGEVGHLGKRLDRLDDLDPQDVAASGIDRVHPSGESGGLEGGDHLVTPLFRICGCAHHRHGAGLEDGRQRMAHDPRLDLGSAGRGGRVVERSIGGGGRVRRRLRGRISGTSDAAVDGVTLRREGLHTLPPILRRHAGEKRLRL